MVDLHCPVSHLQPWAADDSPRNLSHTKAGDGRGEAPALHYRQRSGIAGSG